VQDPKGITFQPLPVALEDKGASPSFMGVRQQHQKCEASLTMEYSPSDENSIAGLAVFSNESACFVAGKRLSKGKEFVTLTKNGKEIFGEPCRKGRITFKVETDGASYSFSYKVGKKKWKNMGSGINASFLSTHNAGGFTGTVIGLYASVGHKETEDAK